MSFFVHFLCRHVCFNLLVCFVVCSGHNASAVALGGAHTCALRENGHVVCWGLNSDGQLGIGNTSNIGTNAAQMGNNLVEVNVGTGPPTFHRMLIFSLKIVSALSVKTQSFISILEFADFKF